MKQRYFCCIFCSLLPLLIFPSNAKPQIQENEFILPAGTLLRCTLNEPNFSSKTAVVGDPVVCLIGGLPIFDRMLLPRGAYLGGHLEADKDPGHFVGKGYLKLEFDVFGLPDQQIPLPAKIIGASGYKVDKEGKIIGHGHATRDAVEWMMPPLWPLKVLTLPARGPRPTLKGEEELTLRITDNVVIPARPLPRRPYLGMSPSEDLPRWNNAPSRYVAPHVPPAPAPSTAENVQVAPSVKVAPPSGASGTAPGSTQNVLVLRNGTRQVATALHMNGNQLNYTLADGSQASVSLDDVDWTKTFQNNAENGAAVAVVDESTRH